MSNDLKAQLAEVDALMGRIHRRTDLVGTVAWRWVIGLVVIWGLASAVNYAVLSKPLALKPKERAMWALSFGPAYGPLGVTRMVQTNAKIGPLKPRLVGLLVGGSFGGILYLLLAPMLNSKTGRFIGKAERHAKAQGRYMLDLAARRLRLKRGGIPLGQVADAVIGIPYGADAGHGLMVAPSRTGKGLHLTETLLAWPGGAVILDPKAEQWERTAGYRATLGPVYRITPHCLDLLQYYDLTDAFDLQELHSHLLRPWADSDPIFAERCLPLFEAARDMGKATGRHPLKLLAEWCKRPAPEVLTEAKRYAPGPIAQFTDGNTEELNRFVLSAWGTFTTRFGPFVPHIATISTAEIPATWAAQDATIYICYPLDQLRVAGPMVSAMVAGLIKGQMRQAEKQYTLFALDEMPTVALGNLDIYLATVGGYGITVLGYVQSLPQITEIYGRERMQAILGNFHHQVYYRPQDHDTAKYVSDQFGTELVVTENISTSTGSNAQHGGSHGGGGSRSQTTSRSMQQAFQPALPPTQLTAMPIAATVVFTAQQGKQYRLVAARMNPIPKLGTLPPAPAARPLPRLVDRLRPMVLPPVAEPPTKPTPPEEVPPEETAPPEETPPAEEAPPEDTTQPGREVDFDSWE